MHSTGPTHRNQFLNFFAEFIGTFVLVGAILSVSLTNNPASNQPWTPLFIGLVVFAIGLSLGGTTGYAINPFRDLVPRIVHQILPIKNKVKSDWGYAWIPVVAPLSAGALAGAIFLAAF